MNALLVTGLQSFGISVVLTPIIRDVFRSFKVVDEPDQGRKVHVQPIPRVGGIGIAVAYAATFYLATPSAETTRDLSLVANILPAAFLVFITGLIDDFFGLKPWQKLIGQLLAAVLAWWAGVQITFITGQPVSHVWSFPLTIGWLLLCTNAFNLVDGLDGLAAGVGLFSTLTIFIAAMVHGNEPLAFATLPLAGCLLGFLCFNFNPATVFLGDGGSLLIGFLLGCFGAIWTQKSVTLFGLTAPLMALSIPLFDVLLCIIRRWLSNRPIFGADRGHIHHKLLDRGLTPRQTVLLLYGFCGLGAVFSLLQTFLNDVYVAAFLVAGFVAVAWFGIHHLRYAEFTAAGEMLRLGEFQRSINARLILSSFARDIAAANSIEECWGIVHKLADTFGFTAVRLHVDGHWFENWDPELAAPQHWTMRVPLSETGYVEFARDVNPTALALPVGPVVDLLAITLSARVKELIGSPTTNSAVTNSGG